MLMRFMKLLFIKYFADEMLEIHNSCILEI